MKKLPNAVLLFFVLMVAIYGGCLALSSRTPVLHFGDTVSCDMLKEQSRIVLENRNENCLYTEIVINENAAGADCVLALADIRSFILYLNGREAYSFEGAPSECRFHFIPLKDYIAAGDVLSIEVSGKSLKSSIKCLIGQEQTVRNWMNAAQLVSTLLVGMYVAIIFNCLFLYTRKKTETYLIYMTLFTVMVALTALLYSAFPFPNFPFRAELHMGYLRGLTEVFCLLLYINLFKIKPVSKMRPWHPVLLVLGVMAVIFLLNNTSYLLRMLSLELLGLLNIGIVLYANVVRVPFSRMILVGAALSEGLALYNTGTNFGWVEPNLVMYYLHLPELYYMLIDMSCLLVVNSIFSQKFTQAEELLSVVELSNRQLDEKVRQRTAELEESNRNLLRSQSERHAMMTNLFHDLRSPLFCAIGYADMMEASLPEPMEESGVLKRELQYISHLIENLFLISKLEEHKITFTQQPVNLTKLCGFTVEEAKLEAENLGKTLELDLEPDRWTVGDGFRLKQVLENLISNAIQHTPKGTKITVSLRKNNTNVLLTVEDNGQGIPREELQNIFERYYVHSPDGNSSGLGLAIAKEIVAAHNGRLYVESEVGAGTKFTVSLPALENQPGQMTGLENE